MRITIAFNSNGIQQFYKTYEFLNSCVSTSRRMIVGTYSNMIPFKLLVINTFLPDSHYILKKHILYK